MAKSSSKFWLAAIAGIAAGIGIGMLIAPAKGAKTRKRLKKKIMRVADVMQDDLSEKVQAFKSAFSSGDREEFEDAEPIKDGKEEK